MKKKIMPTTCLFIALIAMLILNYAFPIKKIITFPFNLTGLIALGFGILINLKADRQMSTHQTNVKPFQESSFLITDGAFAISRNPMYLGFLAILTGVFLLLGSISTFIIIIIFPILINHFYIRIEEKMLAARFTSQWQTYKNKIRRWL